MVAGDILTPDRDDHTWVGSRLMTGQDAEGNRRIIFVDAEGQIRIQAELQVSDIQIGAVEIKDYDSELRLDIAVDGANNAAYVQSNSLASQATLATLATQATAAANLVQTAAIRAAIEAIDHLITAGAGNVDAGTQRVTIAGNDANLAAITTAIQLIDHLSTADAGNSDAGTQRVTLATDDLLSATSGATGAAVPTRAQLIAGEAEETVPPELADGQLGSLLLTLFRKLIIAGYDYATQTIMVTDASPAQMQKQFETDWATQTTPGDETAPRGVRDYENILISYTIATINTSVDLIIWGSFDGGVTYHPIWSDTILAADDQDDTVSFVGMALTHVKCEFDGEAGGVAATVSWQMGDGN